MMAAGVARPMAQGQATTSTATALTSARVMAGGGPSRSHATKVTRAVTMTAGVNTRTTRSASPWMGSLEPWARSTRRMIWASTVRLPTSVAVSFRTPC